MRTGVWTRRIFASRLAARLHLAEILLAALLIPVLLLPLLPLLPYPGDHDIVMRIWFRDAGTRVARNFSLPISAGMCSELQYAMTDGDPKKGAFTKVGC